LGEHLVCNQGVTGSSPVSSTKFNLGCSELSVPNFGALNFEQQQAQPAQAGRWRKPSQAMFDN
jgi:hypothetical protein